MQDRRRPPQTLDELRRLLTPEMWDDLRRAAPLARQALDSGFPDRLILPRSFCLDFAGWWELPDDPETISGLVQLYPGVRRRSPVAAGHLRSVAGPPLNSLHNLTVSNAPPLG